MGNLVKTFAVTLLIIIPGAMLVPSFTVSAKAQLCVLLICKDAGTDGEGITFSFEEEQNGVVQNFELVSGSECHETSFFDANNDLTITENPTPGFVLDNVVCSGISGESVVITEVNGGIIAECLSSDEGTCTFINVPGSTATNIPTLSEWGLIVVVGGLMLVGVFFAVRRKKSQAGA